MSCLRRLHWQKQEKKLSGKISLGTVAKSKDRPRMGLEIDDGAVGTIARKKKNEKKKLKGRDGF